MKHLIALLVQLFAWAQQPQYELVDAVRAGNVAAVRTLTTRGADPNAPVGRHGWTPLLHAVHAQRLVSAAALLDAGAAVDRRGRGGVTPLMMAAGYGDRRMVALLLRRGANPRLRDSDNDAAIDYALTGVNDVDRMTLFSCQNATAAMLAGVPPQTSSARWARMKGCRVPSPSSRS